MISAIKMLLLFTNATDREAEEVREKNVRLF